MTTRKAITPSIKRAVLHYHAAIKHKQLTQKRVAVLCGISERSVKRIFDEAGLATAVPLLKGQAYTVLKLLKEWGINPDTFKQFLEEAKETGMLVKGDQSVQAQIVKPTPTPAQMVKAITEMGQEAWSKLLHDIVTARVAKNANTSVATAMLNISNAVDKNAKQSN